MKDVEVVVALEELFKDERLLDFKGKVSITYDFGGVEVLNVGSCVPEQTIEDLEETIESLEEENSDLSDLNYDLEDQLEELKDEAGRLRRALNEIGCVVEESSY